MEGKLMLNKSKRWLLSLVLCCLLALSVTGCDQLKKTPETESESETEPPTESETETEPETEPPTETEPETEPPTESETETEPQTEPETFTTDTTVEEEEATYVSYDTLKLLYAADELNVRENPGTDADIFESFTTGAQLTVVGETANWYEVEIEDYDSTGYVYKGFVSATAVDASSDTESGGDNAASETSTTAGSSSTSAIDTQYGVETYAESFPIRATAGANIRTEPSQDGEIVTAIASDTTVTAVGYTDRWYKVTYNGVTGYVNKNLFSTE